MATKYAKRIPITETIKKEITRINAGNEIDFDAIAIYETRTVNTKTLRKRGGLYQGARIDKSVLEEMVESLNNSVEGVPMHLMHETQALNVGKAFRAKMVQRNDGHFEVVSQFYIPVAETALVARLDTGAVDQVSVGLLAKQVKCSHCDYDWRQAGMREIMDLTCKNKHTVGKDGVHVVSTGGLEKWFELSLVDSGAATDARITSAQASQFIETEDVYRLAANNQNQHGTTPILVANLSEIFSEELNDMDEAKVNELIAAALKAQGDDVQAKIDAAVKAAVDPKDTEIADLKAKLAEAEAKIDTDSAAKLTETESKLAASEANLKTATDFIYDEAKKAQIAAGSNNPAEVATLDEGIAKIKESGLLIAKLYAKPEEDATNLEAKSDYVISDAFRRK